MKDTFTIIDVDINLLKPSPYQARQIFDPEAIIQLAHSIQKHGLINPIIIEKFEGHYYIVAGERRVKAIQQLNGTSVRAQLLKKNAQEIALSDNMLRENLTAIEEARAFYEMSEQGYSFAAIAKIAGKRIPYIRNQLRLLSLHPRLQKAILERTVEYTVLRPLVTLPHEEQLALLQQIIEKKLSAHKVESMIKRYKKTKSFDRKPTIPIEDIQYINQELNQYLGATTTCTSSTKGMIKIYYKDLEQLTNILERIGLVKT